jgi:hypothetical protein
MSSWRTSSDTTGPRAKCETVVYEAIAKAAEIIVHARCPLAPFSEKSSSRFNLHVPEIDQVRYVVVIAMSVVVHHVLVIKRDARTKSLCVVQNLLTHTFHSTFSHLFLVYIDHHYNDGDDHFMSHYDWIYIMTMAIDVNY